MKDSHRSKIQALFIAWPLYNWPELKNLAQSFCRFLFRLICSNLALHSYCSNQHTRVTKAFLTKQTLNALFIYCMFKKSCPFLCSDSYSSHALLEGDCSCIRSYSRVCRFENLKLNKFSDDKFSDFNQTFCENLQRKERRNVIIMICRINFKS